MYGCESWTMKAECQQIDAFKLWCWRRLLRVSWTVRRSNQSILKEINPEYSLEGPMLKQKVWYFGYLIWRANSLENTLILGKAEGRRRGGQQRMRWLAGITESMDMSFSRFQKMVKDREAWYAAIHGVAKHWTWQWLNNNIHINIYVCLCVCVCIYAYVCVCIYINFLFFGLMQDLLPNQGSNLCPLQWKHGFLTTGPPRKSLFFKVKCW